MAQQTNEGVERKKYSGAQIFMSYLDAGDRELVEAAVFFHSRKRDIHAAEGRRQ